MSHSRMQFEFNSLLETGKFNDVEILQRRKGVGDIYCVVILLKDE